MFWNFTIFQQRSDLPQLKRNLISSTANLVHQLLYELANDLRKLGNIKKISNLGVHIAQCLVSLQELRLCLQQFLAHFAKNTQKQISNFSSPVQLCWIFQFVQNILFGIVVLTISWFSVTTLETKICRGITSQPILLHVSFLEFLSTLSSLSCNPYFPEVYEQARD